MSKEILQVLDPFLIPDLGKMVLSYMEFVPNTTLLIEVNDIIKPAHRIHRFRKYRTAKFELSYCFYTGKTTVISYNWNDVIHEFQLPKSLDCFMSLYIFMRRLLVFMYNIYGCNKNRCIIKNCGCAKIFKLGFMKETNNPTKIREDLDYFFTRIMSMYEWYSRQGAIDLTHIRL